MNTALLSSKKMDYCTTQDFFDKLDQEFHFALDAAATKKSAKCQRYYTPAENGLEMPWSCGGGRYSAIRPMDGRPESGSARRGKRLKKEQPSFC